MRTFNGLSSGTIGFPHYQNGLYRYKHRSEEKKEKSPSRKRRNNDFLTGRILPVTSKELKVSTEEGTINVATAENYRYLLASAENYARLIGQTLKVKKGKTPSHSISILYNALDTIIPQHLNIEVQGGKLTFCLYEYHKWPDYTFFWLPIRFMETLSPKLKRITHTFLHLLVRHQRIYSINDMPTFDYIAEYLSELEADEDCTVKQCREISNLVFSYGYGAICRKLQRVHNKRYYNNLPRAMKTYRPQGKKEQRLLTLIREGLKLIAPAKPSIMEYQYDLDEMEERDYPPVELERLILLSYDINDRVNEEMGNSLNAELRESYDLTPISTCTLSPDTCKPFKKDDYPEKFSKWFIDFTTFINENF